MQLLREAPSPALRACADLAQAYPPLAGELFHASFVSCWFELNDQYQDNLVRSLETAFRSETIPQEILVTLLNLAEFMEHDVEALPIDIRVLADLAIRCRAYAKALHYKELEYKKDPKGVVEVLISINQKLDLPDAALGVLKAVQKLEEEEQLEEDEIEVEEKLEEEGEEEEEEEEEKEEEEEDDDEEEKTETETETETDTDTETETEADEDGSINSNSSSKSNFGAVEVKESYLAKLGNWSEALVLYKRRLKEDSEDVASVVGCMRCLDARGEWENVLKLQSNFAMGEDNMSEAQDYKKALKFCAKAAWRLGR